MSRARDLANFASDSQINAGEIEDNAVTTAKIADNAITVAKIGDGAVHNVKLANSTIIMSGDSGTDSVALGETMTVAGGTGLTSTGSSNTITISLDNTAVTAGSYGSSTAIPTFTVDAQGRLTAASTTAISSDMSIAGDSGTDTITVGTDTFTIAGGTGLTSTATTDTITLNIDSTVATLTGTQTLTNKTINSASNTITITESNISDLGAYITASSTDTLTNKSGNISQWTNDSGYLTSFTETNDLSSAVTWANVPDANITQSSVTQHQAALSITESQISDLGSYITASSTDTLTNKTIDTANNTITITESNISDLGSYIENVSEDTTPQLGGNLDLNSNDITGTGNINITGNATFSGNLTVNGTTTTVNSTTIEITNSFTFEGATADGFETVLGVVDPTADRTINLPNASGTVVLKDTTDTLTNKTINSASNTITITESNISDLGSYIENVVEDTTPQLGGDLSTNGNDINFGDNDKAQFGDSNDLQIFHDSASGYGQIKENGPAGLLIRSNDLRLQSSTGENGIIVNENGAVNLYYDNSKKFETTSAGVFVTGNISTADNGKFISGTSADLQIYHDGSNSFIDDQGTGNLYIRATNLQLQNYGSSAYLSANSGGDVTLYHNGIAKLATTSTGIDVTGTVVSDGLTVDGNAQINGDVTVFDGTGDPFVKLQTNEQETVLRIDNSASDIFQIRDATNSANRLGISTGGDISFYEDTGTTPKLFWDASAERLGIGTTSPTSNLDIRTISGTISDFNQTLTVEERTAWTQGIAMAVYFADLYASDRPSAFLGTVNNLSSFILSGGARVTNNPDGGSWATSVGTASTFLRGTNGEFRVYGDTGLTADTAFTPTERLRVSSSGTLTQYGGGAVFNENSNDSDFRVESNGNTHMLFVDGGNDRVGIGTSSPNAKLEVAGKITIDSSSSVAGSGLTLGDYSGAGYKWIQSFENQPLSINPLGNNVGIGVTSPSTRLHVNGTVKATAFQGDGSGLTGVASDVVDDTTPQLGGDLDGNGRTINLTGNTSSFGLPRGTDAQKPTASSNEGHIRYNTDDNLVYYSDGNTWLAINATAPAINSIDGSIYVGVASTLTINGNDFGAGNVTVNFLQSSDGINSNVTVTPTSGISLSVAVPAAVYNNVTSGNNVTIKVTAANTLESNSVNKTGQALPSGGTITTSGSTRTHTFNSSGTLSVPSGFSVSANYLVVAGGGGAGSDRSGGGGAGGYISGSTTISSGSYTITIGGGGAGGPSDGTNGTNGSNSSAFSQTAIGGGRSGNGTNDNNPTQSASGGSGGGGNGTDNAATNGASGTSGQGNDGGDAITVGGTGGGRSGGGGGAGAAGGNASSGAAGDGGAGSQWLDSNYYAGGGGGGTDPRKSSSPGDGGIGGGGDGGGRNIRNPTSGTANTGGGGGGSTYDPGSAEFGGSGGSGVVKVRYTI